MRLRLCLLLSICVLASAASAQQIEEPESLARFHLGPVRLAPSVTLGNIGIDTNVFNDLNNPHRDFTITTGTRVDMWWRFRRAHFSSNDSVDFVYFSRSTGQRSVNPGNQVKVYVPLNRFSPYASVTLRSSHERPTAEIDIRADRMLTTKLAGSEVRLTGKLLLDMSGAVSRTTYKNGPAPLAAALHTSLTGEDRQASVAVRYTLTPLTMMVLAVERQSHAFDFSPERNGESFYIRPQVVFKPFALVRGNASIGYRRFRPNMANVPSSTGVAADVNLSYTVMGLTRLSTAITRDISFSFEATQPYYLLTAISASMERHLVGPLDVLARIGRQELAYRSIVPGSSRIDLIGNYGASFAYRLGRDRRLAVDVDRARRTSSVTNRRYQGWRFGMSATYPL